MRFPKKMILLLIAATLLLTLSVSGTTAFLVADTPAVVNTFTPVEVDTKIVETLEAGKKSSIKVENKNEEQNIDVYVRVAVVGHWVDKEGNIVAPWQMEKYNTTDWTMGNDGFYYYNQVLKVGETTADLLLENSPIMETNPKPEYADRLMVTVVHQAIQTVAWAEGVDTAQKAFEAAAQAAK